MKSILVRFYCSRHTSHSYKQKYSIKTCSNPHVFVECINVSHRVHVYSRESLHKSTESKYLESYSKFPHYDNYTKKLKSLWIALRKSVQIRHSNLCHPVVIVFFVHLNDNFLDLSQALQTQKPLLNNLSLILRLVGMQDLANGWLKESP